MPKEREINDLIGGIFFLFLGFLGLAVEIQLFGFALFSFAFGFLLLPTIPLLGGTAFIIDYFSRTLKISQSSENTVA